jgi:hypothetical protein
MKYVRTILMAVKKRWLLLTVELLLVLAIIGLLWLTWLPAMMVGQNSRGQ